VLKGLIELYEAWGKPEKAAEYRELVPAAAKDRQRLKTSGGDS
jgi:hypothetical protein